MAAESYWSWLLQAWLSSPGVAWFIFFNVVVGAVVVLSWPGQQGGEATLSTRRRLTRSASSMVMDRLRSLSSCFSFHTAADYGSITPPASQMHHAQEYYAPPVMSMAEPGTVAAADQSGTAAMAPPSAPLATAAEDLRAAPSSTSEGGEKAGAEAESREKMHMFLDEVRAGSSRSPPAAAAIEPAAAAATAEMPTKVSGIVKRRAYAEVEGKEEVNARAERFIRQFREDLKLERLNSILGYSRCAGGAPAQ